MGQHADVLLLGGGVIGLTAAYFLAREKVRVRVVDQGNFGRESSWAGAGILPPANLNHAHSALEILQGYSSTLFPALSADLEELTGINNGYLRCGGVQFLSETDQSRKRERRGNEHNPSLTLPALNAGPPIDEWHGPGAETQCLQEADLRRLEPALAAGLGQGIFLPEMAQLRNPRHLQALLAACQSLGVILTAGCPIHGFVTRDSQVQAVQTSTGPIHAGQFILTTGAWTDSLLEPLGWRPGIHPVRGQIALLNPGPRLFERILILGSRYLVPRAEGRVLVGSTEEKVGFNRGTTAAAIRELLQLAMALVPALAQTPVECCWAGLRPGSPDGLPFLGPVPGFENLLMAAGHYRAGIQLSPGTALVLKEMILQQPLSVPLEPFRLDRIASSQ